MLNGIAWDTSNRELYLTGKLWPWVYRVVLDKKTAPYGKHAPHFSVLDEEGRLTFHVLETDTDYMEAFADHDPLTFESNFESLKKSQCSDCHVPRKAGDGCVVCHNYHVGTFPPLTVSTAGMTKEAKPSELSQSE